MIDLNFDSFGYEIITKTLIAKKAVDEGNILILALNLYLNMHELILDEGLSKGTENILKEQYS